MDFCEDIREQYREMRDEFMAGLEDRKYLTIDQVRAKGLQVQPFCSTLHPSACCLGAIQFMHCEVIMQVPICMLFQCHVDNIP